MHGLWAVLVWFGLSMTAMAQVYPDYTSTTVNDFVDLLPPEAEQSVSDKLSALKATNDVEMTLVTLERAANYTGGLSIPDYATELFNTWGIGDATRNDGILILVFKQDREIRIALGSGYGREWDRAAKDAIDQGFLPAFRQENYPAGIEDGIQQTIDRIVVPFQNGDIPKAPIDWERYSIFGLFGAFFAYFVGKGPFQKYRLKRRACPKCGQTGGLQQTQRTTTPATRSSSGWGVRTTTCSYCDYRDEDRYTISQKSSSSGGFGGGRSSGGGASGKW